jgi:hypothetical protein
VAVLSIIIDGGKLRAYEYLNQLAEYADWQTDHADALWNYLLTYPSLYEEFIYYLSHHEIKDELAFKGYGILDLYVWQMNHYNMIHDIGKNTGNCNKEDLVLRAFYMMGEFMENPAPFERKLKEELHQDRL